MNILRYYLIGINVLTCIVWWVDKRIARANGVRLEESKEQWKNIKDIQTTTRVSEKTLLVLMICWGVIGAYVGMHFFRHKTLKGSFLWKFWSIVVVWLAIVVYVLFYRVNY